MHVEETGGTGMSSPGAGARESDSDHWADMDPATLRAFLSTAAKLWLAHDGLWFQAVERRGGLELAMDCDRDAWERFSPIEARRIMGHLQLVPGGGLTALARALGYRLYSHLNRQRIEWPASDRLVLTMETCRVQDARCRKGLPDFPCKSIGIVEYETFARTIDPRIHTRCLACPPDARGEDRVCAWEFTLDPEPEA